MFCTSFVILLLFCVPCKCLNTYDFIIEGNDLNGYYVSVFMGTPAQRINMLVDTGSSNLAVAAVPYMKKNSHYFMYNESQTLRRLDVNVRLRYVEGEWNGFLALDVFNPCIDSDCSIVCNISCMTNTKNIFDYYSQFQGIMGLAYSSIANPNPTVRPFFDVFTEVKNIKNIFALQLCGPFFSNKQQTTSCGKFHVGYYSKIDFRGNIMYTPIVREWFYEITLTDIKVNEISVPVTCDELNKNKSFVDSGTTELNVPESVFHWILSEIKTHVENSYPSQLWINETTMCTQKPVNISEFPNITISLYHSKNSSFYITISPELYILHISNLTGYCVKVAIGISNYGSIIGSSVLKGFYVVFDRDRRQMGFAKPAISPHHFISDVSDFITEPIDFDKCIRKDFPTELSTSVLVIIGLCLLCIIAAILLYALIRWIWNFHIKYSDAESDTSSLVDDE